MSNFIWSAEEFSEFTAEVERRLRGTLYFQEILEEMFPQPEKQEAIIAWLEDNDAYDDDLTIASEFSRLAKVLRGNQPARMHQATFEDLERQKQEQLLMDRIKVRGESIRIKLDEDNDLKLTLTDVGFDLDVMGMSSFEATLKGGATITFRDKWRYTKKLNQDFKRQIGRGAESRIEELHTTARANAAGEELQAIDAELNAARMLLRWCEGSTNA